MYETNVIQIIKQIYSKYILIYIRVITSTNWIAIHKSTLLQLWRNYYDIE